MSPPRRKGQPTPVLLPRKSHEQRSLVGYSSWGRKEQLSTHNSPKRYAEVLTPGICDYNSIWKWGLCNVIKLRQGSLWWVPNPI